MRKLKTLVLATVAASLFAATAAQAERGSDGNVNIAYWQAVSILNPFLSGGTKDVEASSLILDPLANYRPDGSMDPALAAEIPTIENGGVAADLRSITWKLKEGIVWSDGSAFTANDVVFSANYCMDPEGGCNAASNFADVESVEALDDLTVRVNFSVAKPFPYGPFVGATSPVIQEAQFKDCMGAKAPECTEANFGPIGTGPFVVDEFRANDVVTFKANDKYRNPNQPAFATAVLKGGGDSAATTRSVLETGEFDYAWNVQVEPEVLDQMQAAGKGKIISAFGTSVERLMVQLTDVRPELGDLRGTVEGGPHPFLSDFNVRKALSLAIDRDILVEVGYGPNGQPTCNVLPAPAIYASTANDACKVQDVDAANALLDEAGWVLGGDGVRAKDGVRLSILFQTSTNSVRQGTQALIKQMWQAIGVETELRNIDAGVFFGGDQSSPDTFQKFFADIEMYTNNFDGTDPEAYMGNWVCSEIPSPSNQWIGNNMPRYCSEDYNALSAEMGKTASIEKRAAMAKKMNDMLMQEYVMIPLIHRGRVSAASNALGNVVLNPWDSELAFAEEWTRN